MNKSEDRDWERHLLDTFALNTDFAAKRIELSDQLVHVYYFVTLVDLPGTLASMNQSLMSANDGNVPLQHLSDLYQIDSNAMPEELAHLLLQGRLVVRSPHTGEPLIFKALEPSISRSVMPPENESPIQGAIDGFTEDLLTNVGLLRKKINHKDVVVVTHAVGSTFCREIALVYLKGKANPKIVQTVADSLIRNKHKDVRHVEDMLSVLGQPKISLVATYLATELPEEAAQNLMDGRVVLFMDQLPYAISVPAILKDVWTLKTDFNYPFLYLLFFRFIRMIGIIFAVIMPGLYVVLNSVNPELLRIQLAISVAKSREGVPYPAFIEVLLMLLVLEMVIEATTRLPKSIGPTITMIGGIILGQAIVQAKLVSNLLIIILAASTIANFTMSGYLNTIGIRIYKYVVLVASAAFGILGLEMSVIWIFVYFAGLKSFTVPYLSLSLKGTKTDE
ncbi:spore germination protein [Cohnella nanjingensis]|uniref:Spore germination protein n=1 Tax=Cohnella nanjingensis TaxID=1387779 RepID=A0A7X0VD15_9BACL|nr:spore germination protein [Cohnella nanjingensis]MBB6669517.1 spore germination protein [Cohnella nanjingensis]